MIGVYFYMFKDGDHYTGYFTDLLTYENPDDRPITLAEETLNDRLTQDRYLY